MSRRATERAQAFRTAVRQPTAFPAAPFQVSSVTLTPASDETSVSEDPTATRDVVEVHVTPNSWSVWPPFGSGTHPAER